MKWFVASTNWIVLYISYFSHCCEQITGKKNLKGERFPLAHTLRVQSNMVGKADSRSHQGSRSSRLCGLGSRKRT